jgi:hypothetical protein
MPICQNCGSEVSEGRDRCDHCGQRRGDKSLDVYDRKDPSVDLLDERRIGLFSCSITAAYADLFGLQSQEY